ncbi:hypothetical protein ABFS83_04G137700 [Erythranthe nasuta]
MPCPAELEKAGMKIAEICEGLPLTIIKVAQILSEADKTAEYWNEVAADKRHSVFVDAYDQMYKVLYPSYDYLDQYLKPCFLYVGAFPQNYEIPTFKLINMWIAEGFPKPYWYEFSYNFAWECLRQLSHKNVVMVHKKSYCNAIKSCGLHSSFWHLCNKEARKNKFFCALNSLADCLAEEDPKSQRRLCVRNNVLFGIQDAYDSIASLLSVRSLLCTGPYHQYPVPICLSLRSLTILDAITIRCYEFPMEVVKLVHLRYLTLTYDKSLPASISELLNLQYLIVRRHLSIKNSIRNSYYLPVEIWDMQELKHLQVMGSDLPHPYCEDSLLPNLLTLLDVSPKSCINNVLERIPNLEKLGIRIESAPDNVEPPLLFLDRISQIHKPSTLKCVIINPKITSGIDVAPRAALSTLPSSLVKLTLSGCGFPWEEMSKISSLPNLKLLKLRCYAFRGPKWEIQEEEFEKLEFLLIEDTDLVNLTVLGDSLSRLQLLSIKHCYKLQKIPLKFGTYQTKIELVECNPLPQTFANELKDLRAEKYYFRHPLVLNVHSSWDI